MGKRKGYAVFMSSRWRPSSEANEELIIFYSACIGVLLRLLPVYDAKRSFYGHCVCSLTRANQFFA